MTGQVIGTPEVLVAACAAVAEGGRYGAIALFTAAGAFSPVFWPAIRDSARALAGRPGMAVTISGMVTDEQRRELMQLGCLVFEEPTHAIEAISNLNRFVRVCANARDASTPVVTNMALPRAGALNEAESLAFLEQAGVRTAPYAVALSADEAAAITQRFDAPVAIKVLSRDLMHKSDVGGVRLNVRGADAARAAFDAIKSDVTRMAPGAAFEGVIVAKMVKPVLECMAGARLDPVFGPVVAFGLGGTEVEWLNRVALVTAPTHPRRVRALLERLDIPRRLDGWRGGPKVPVDGLVDAVCGVAQLAAAAGKRLVNLEINPLMVTTEGVFAADAVVELGDGR